MHRLLALGLIAVIAPGCLFTEHGSGGGGDDVCVQTDGVPAIAPAPLRDPNDLTCDSFGGGCNPTCGPCPEFADLAPIPSWGVCGSSCDSLGASACASDPSCRTVKDASCTVGPNTCLTDFLGCFPTDTQPDNSIDCFTADAWNCSRSHQCTAHHSQQPCPLDGQGDCARPFATCTPIDVEPGHCTGQVICARPPPACPSGSTPGIANGCFTGACIVNAACPGMN
ncbi:hypothetical protein BH11MYX3_BH11MYX3_45000 [soil metagenome]